MKSTKICLVLAVVVVIASAGQGSPDDNQDTGRPRRQYSGRGQKHLHEEEQMDYYERPVYTYEYQVNDQDKGDLKRHRESREDGAVRGYYSLLEADGKLRTVHYTADDENGFNAIVSRHDPQESSSHSPAGITPKELRLAL